MNSYRPKKSKKIFDRRSVFFSTAILLMFGYMVYQQSILEKTMIKGSDAQMKSFEVYRELGNKLKSEKMYLQAIEAYRNYLTDPSLRHEVKANIYYMIGNLYFENMLFEEALSAYYTADIIGVPAPIAGDVNIKIVNCLERLGREFSAEYALQSRSALDKSDQSEPQGVVVAEFGDRKVTMRDLDEALEMLDEKTRQEYRDPQKKFQFLQQYLSQELLARKAEKMGYDKDVDILRKTEEIKKRFMIEKMVRTEFDSNVKIDPQDILNYYEANKARYDEPASLKLAHILVDTYEKAEAVLAKINAGDDFWGLAQTDSMDSASKINGGAIDAWLSLKKPTHNGIDYTELIKVSLEKADTSVVRIVQDSRGYHLVKVLDVKQAKQKSYQDVAQQVAQDYQIMKAQGLYGQMMENILKVEGVKIHHEFFSPESFSPAGSSQISSPTAGQIQKPVQIQKIDQ